MTAQKVYDTASKVTPVNGEVAIDGPDGVGLSLTPRAAKETGERLINAAAIAEGQTPEENDEDEA